MIMESCKCNQNELQTLLPPRIQTRRDVMRMYSREAVRWIWQRPRPLWLDNGKVSDVWMLGIAWLWQVREIR